MNESAYHRDDITHGRAPTQGLNYDSNLRYAPRGELIVLANCPGSMLREPFSLTRI